MDGFVLPTGPVDSVRHDRSEQRREWLAGLLDKVRELHAGNVLAAHREPWLMIDPKPYVGDPAYDGQHLLNCEETAGHGPGRPDASDSRPAPRRHRPDDAPAVRPLRTGVARQPGA